ncbi:hypothetical protein LZC95_19685 [Pendulispora brunnea]|uniref:Uncharacterized protein n=1 Tax=Pendulispora brunnea TaxID=2905690 RepID=A0ABZ2KK37_9BACT
MDKAIISTNPAHAAQTFIVFERFAKWQGFWGPLFRIGACEHQDDIRSIAAVARTLAAQAELAVPDGKDWVVDVDVPHADVARVTIHLGNTDDYEEACAIFDALLGASPKDVPKAPSKALCANLGHSESGVLEPELLLSAHEMGRREVLAAAHLVALEVERATPRQEGWRVFTRELCEGRAVVYLELRRRGDGAEAARAMSVLRAVARQ